VGFMETRTYDDYRVGWIAPLPFEMAAAIAMFDEIHPSLARAKGDENTYVLGCVAEHNVVLASLPLGEVGSSSAAQVAIHMQRTFLSVQVGLLVGIGGGVCRMNDVRLGDVVVSEPSDETGGLFQYGFGEHLPGGFKVLGFLNAPPRPLRSAVAAMRAWHDFPGQNKIPEYLSPRMNPKLPSAYFYPETEADLLFAADYIHPTGKETCENCDRTRVLSREVRTSWEPIIHYGVIASGNQVVKDGVLRDALAAKHETLCFDTEAAGLMNSFPCIVVRGISGYADSHKSQSWQKYAAASAAAYAKELLRFLPREARGDLSRKRVEKSSGSPFQFSQSAGLEAGARVRFLPYATEPIQSVSNSKRDNAICSTFSTIMPKMLNWDEVALGRLVINLNDPSQDYYPPTETELALQEVSVDYLIDVRAILGFPKVFEMIRRIFDPGQSRQAVMEKLTKESITYRLMNTGAVFERLLEYEGAKRWLEKFCHRSHIYFVVAIHLIRQGLSAEIDSVSSSRPHGRARLIPGDRDQGTPIALP
jgi:nucleoside phosphorylase